MDTSHPNLRAALDRLERATESGASGWRLLLYAMTLAPIGIAVPLLLYESDVGAILSEEVRLLLIASVIVTLFSFAYSFQIRRIVRQRLSESALALRIATAELFEDTIFERTAWPWRLMLPRGRASETGQEIQPVLRRVAGNLDWYISPRQRLWRWQWVYNPLVAIVLAYGLVILVRDCVLVTPHGGLFFDWPPNTLPAVLPLLTSLLPLPFIHFRRQVWTEELVRHLRERLEA